MLGNPSAAGSQAASPFSLIMSNHSINMTATVVSQSSLAGDSIGDQIYALTHSTSSTTKHLGAILGSSIGSAVALLLLLATAVAFGRGWLKQRHLQKQTAAWHKVNLQCCCACCKRCSAASAFLPLSVLLCSSHTRLLKACFEQPLSMPPLWMLFLHCIEAVFL